MREDVVRDHFAAWYGTDRIEVTTGFGRADVMLPEYVVEVEPFYSWRRGARQALGYAQETGKKPALAIYGSIPANEALRIWDRCHPKVAVFMLDGDTWHHIKKRLDIARDWREPTMGYTPRRRSKLYIPEKRRPLFTEVARRMGIAPWQLAAWPEMKETIARWVAEERAEAAEAKP